MVGSEQVDSGASRSSFSLLERVRARDQLAWRQLVELYGPVVAFWCQKYDLQPADIADVTQSVFMAIARNPPDFSQSTNSNTDDSLSRATPDSVARSNSGRSGRFRRWLAVVTRRRIIDFVRAKRPDIARGGSSAMNLLLEQVDPQPSGGWSSIDASGVTSNDANLSKEQILDLPDGQWQGVLSRAMEQIRGEFHAKTWLAFWRSVVDGQATDLVAAELKVSEANIRQARSRILRRLRQQLGDL